MAGSGKSFNVRPYNANNQQIRGGYKVSNEKTLKPCQNKPCSDWHDDKVNDNCHSLEWMEDCTEYTEAPRPGNSSGSGEFPGSVALFDEDYFCKVAINFLIENHNEDGDRMTVPLTYLLHSAYKLGKP